MKNHVQHTCSFCSGTTDLKLKYGCRICSRCEPPKNEYILLKRHLDYILVTNSEAMACERAFQEYLLRLPKSVDSIGYEALYAAYTSAIADYFYKLGQDSLR